MMPVVKDGVVGYEKCPGWLKLKYIESRENKCEVLACEHKDLQIHRIKRGNKGGLYTILPKNHPKNNVIVLCKKHHKAMHAHEKGCLSK